MTHGHTQRCEDGLWERGAGWVEGARGKNWGNCNDIKYFLNRHV